MHDRQASSVCRAIGEWNRGRLVVIFQHSGIVLHFVNEGQFNSVAFKLDGDAHFAAGITTGDVLATASNTTSRIMGPYSGDGRTCRFDQPESYTSRDSQPR